MKNAVRRVIRRVTPLFVRVSAKALYDAESRMLLNLLIRRDTHTHQTTPTTYLDRYPETFAAARSLLKDSPTTRILSFGCSTGEEVLSLRKYFPTSAIVGAEINQESLEQCRKLKVDGAITFVESAPDQIDQLAPFDAIFAMSVLQRLPHLAARKHITNLAALYPFAQFERQIRAFDRWTRAPGLIVIQNTQYRFSDTDVSAKYDVVGSSAAPESARTYDRRSRLISGAPYTDTIFRKRIY